ncbi:helix-turn-helix domain-containing protein [Pedobacter insulae]|uniref:Helix-turn-helix domain-containing protein n=1 Tax=Pedobacter insulae TaxID=414048 RepID=A0A1I2X9H3_9SPHI|nr:helix-turn-helix transcriptional regulator [Pedobacter insulae]SFH09609.1 Helix-turn-helix domain-containing protein [Pedobacter insulae]
MDSIGENIRKIRVLLGIKQAVMAKMLKLSVNFYGKIERNEVDIKTERLAQIARIFDIDLIYIINFNLFLENLKGKPSDLEVKQD